jgi:hypothetical protein
MAVHVLHLKALECGYPILHMVLNLVVHGVLDPMRHWVYGVFPRRTKTPYSSGIN